MKVLSSLTGYSNSAISFDRGLMLSIVIRTIVVGGNLSFAVKSVGSKGAYQLTISQLIIILSLGNIITEPIINNETSFISMVTVVIIIILVF